MDGRLHNRLGAACWAAEEASLANRDALVEIHVGSEVWEALRDLATHPGSTITTEPIAKMFGYPLFPEATWEPDAIQVHTRIIIH